MHTMIDIRRGLDKARGQWPKIAKDTGLDYFTIARIARGDTKSPRIDTVELLSKWLDLHGAPPTSAPTAADSPAVTIHAPEVVALLETLGGAAD